MLITILAEELDVPIQGGGSTTFRREEVQGGLEPDQCFYVQNVDRIVGRDEIDLTRDPPPDLAVEVEISRRSLRREGVYARLGVPELWRDNGREVRAYRPRFARRSTRRRSQAIRSTKPAPAVLHRPVFAASASAISFST